MSSPNTPRPEPQALGEAVRLLEQGGVIAYPTETVWGLGCDPDQQLALEAVLTLKARPADKGLILVADDVARFEPWLSGLAAPLRERFAAPTDVPTTWLVPDNGRAHPLVRGRFDSVALRISSHYMVCALTHALGRPIVSTSANRAGESPCRSIDEVRAVFGDRVTMVAGEAGVHARPSRIRDLVTGCILRD